jgi:hypothetical protein
MYLSIAIHLGIVPFEPAAWEPPLARDILALVLFVGIQAFYVALTRGMARGRPIGWVKWLLPLFFVWGFAAAIRNFHDHYAASRYWAIAHMLGFVALGGALLCYFFGSARDWIRGRLWHGD